MACGAIYDPREEIAHRQTRVLSDALVDAVVDRVAALSERGYNWPRRPKRKLLS
jgi:hypothetical protein